MKKDGEKTSQETGGKKNHDESYEECNGLEKGRSGFSSSDQERFSRDGDI